MVFSPSGNYIVGASETKNTEFQKKCKNKINLNLQDCVELSCVRESVLTSENYNDIMKVKGMPESIFGDKFGYEMQKEIAGYMQSYYAGETRKKDIENKSKLTLDGGFDFNSGWNHHFRRQHSRGSIEDESLAPPEKFKMYYKENHNTSGLGVLAIWAGENKKEIGVPFQIIPDSLKELIFNVSDLIEFSKNETAHWEEYNAFCKNFDIFTRWYAYVSSINMQAGNYEPNYE